MGETTTSATVCIDPGFRNFAIAIISQDTLVHSDVWDLSYGMSYTLFKDKVDNWRECLINILKRKLNHMENTCKGAKWLYGEWTLLVEKQMSHDLIWLTGVVQGVIAARPFPTTVGKLYRSCDACKAFGIPANKKIICREDKKRKTEAVVKQYTGFDIDTDHEADAVLLYMYHNNNKRQKKN